MSELEQLIDAELEKISPFPFNSMEKKAIRDGTRNWLEQNRKEYHLEYYDSFKYAEEQVIVKLLKGLNQP